MASSAKKFVRKSVSVNPGNEASENTELLLERKSFNTEDIRTSIILLSSKDYNVLLKAVGTLSRYATQDERYLEQYVAFGIYPRLVALLETEDIVILKFTLKILAMLARNNFMSRLHFRDILICNEMSTRFYIDSNDTFVKECCSSILLQHAKYNELIINQIYSDELIEAIFAVLKNSEDIDVFWNSLNLFYNLLNVEMAKEDIPRNQFFSTKVLFCLMECEQDGVKELVIDIFQKVSSWRTKAAITLLTKENVLQTMVNLLLTGGKVAVLEKVFNIIQNCISNEECALEFARTIQFREFIGWLKKCSNRSILAALPILTILTKIPKLRQSLFDLCFDQLVVSWMKYQHEKVILYLLQMISNLTAHKRCCKTFSKYAVVKTIKDYILNENLPTEPYTVLALQTLRNLLHRSSEILDHFIACDGMNLIQDFFVNKQRNLTSRAYKNVVGIMHFLMLSSKCTETLLIQPILQKIFAVYRRNRDLKLKMLSLINSLTKHEIFRNYLVESGKTENIFNGLRNDRTSFGSQLHLEVISNLVKYEGVAYQLLSLDILTYLKTIKRNVDMEMVNNIIEDLYDYSLTVKFYETHRLEAHNKIDEKFYLIQDENVSLSDILSMDFESSKHPVYVVSVMLVKIVRDVDKSILSFSSDTAVPSVSRRRILSVTSSVAQSNVKLKAIYEHGQIPEKVLLQRMGCASKEIQFYEDYYLERYILSLMRELYYSDEAPKTQKERIKYIAKFVVRQMSGIFFNLNEDEEAIVFQDHLSKLQDSIGMSVIPIGYVRMGYYCERALLFKVLCDNLFVPTTLCKRDVDIFWNEVRFTVTHDGESFTNQEDTVYIVDLMFNVGNLIPINSLEAGEYLYMDTCL